MKNTLCHPRFLKRTLCGFVVALAIGPAVRADVRPAPVLADGAVLQGGMPVRIWGTADKDEAVTVRFQDRVAATVAGADGRWSVQLKDLPVGGPYELTVSGKNRITFKDILVGEVWICAGQSNMRTNLNDRVPNNKEIIRKADDADLRLFDLDNKNGWVKSTPKAAESFPTVPYIFARALRAARGCPVGVVIAAANGSNIESWLHPDTLKSLQRGGKGWEKYESAFFGMLVMPIAPMSVRGVAWYQGESNADTLEHARNYRRGLTEFINDWRKEAGRDDLPFLLVQIAPFHKPTDAAGDSPLAEVRQAQWLVSRDIPHVGLVVTTDVGEEGDIHPHNKEPIGVRLSLAARALAYKEEVEGSGPVVEGAQVEDGEVTLKFSHAAGGLTTKSKEVLGFHVAGADGEFHAAAARIDQDKAILRSKAVPNPKTVRFGWEDYPVVDLGNKSGLPASPFEVAVTGR